MLHLRPLRNLERHTCITHTPDIVRPARRKSESECATSMVSPPSSDKHGNDTQAGDNRKDSPELQVI